MRYIDAYNHFFPKRYYDALLETPAGSLLVDCGLYQGHRKEADQKNRHLPFDASAIDAVVLSHAHIEDVIGAVVRLEHQVSVRTLMDMLRETRHGSAAASAPTAALVCG